MIWDFIPYMGNDATSIDTRLAARLAGLRTAQGWSLEMLAERSGISRATLSRIERGETSPTASLLGRLCSAYGRTMSRLLAEVETGAVSLLRAADQAIWVDPATGFRRCAVSPPAAGYRGEVLTGELPAGATIGYESPPVVGMEQHVWTLDGELELLVEGETYRLRPGDTLRYRLFGPTRFHAPGASAARYLVMIVQP